MVLRNCVARISRAHGRTQHARFGLLLCEADVLWAPEFEHSVQCAYGNGNFARATPIGAGSYPPPVFHVLRTRNLDRLRPSPTTRSKRLMSASTRARQ